MKKKTLFKPRTNLLPYLIAAAVIIACFIGFRYQYDLLIAAQGAFEQAITSTNMERSITREIVDKQKREVDKLAKEARGLQSDLAEVRNILSETAQALDSAKERTVLLTREKTSLNTELGNLRKEYKSLEKELAQIANEKYTLEKKLTDISSLKEAIYRVKQEARRAHIQALKELDRRKLSQGNRGYVTKNGSNTYKKNIFIKVVPLEARN